MLLYYLKETCTGIILLMAAVTACALYAYRVDSRRPDDDPEAGVGDDKPVAQTRRAKPAARRSDPA